MLFFKLWLTGIIISVITGIIIRKKGRDVSVVVNGHTYQKGEINVGWIWIPITLSFGLLSGIPNALLLIAIIKYFILYDVVLAILISIIAMLITICLTEILEFTLMGISKYFEYYQKIICTCILITTILIWTIVFYIL